MSITIGRKVMKTCCHTTLTPVGTKTKGTVGMTTVIPWQEYVEHIIHSYEVVSMLSEVETRN